MTPPELRALIADSVALWGVPARTTLAERGVALTLADGTLLAIHAAAPGERPVRWWLDRAGHRRPCTGVLGLLRALRHACGAPVEDARRLRTVAPHP